MVTTACYGSAGGSTSVFPSDVTLEQTLREPFEAKRYQISELVHSR